MDPFSQMKREHNTRLDDADSANGNNFVPSPGRAFHDALWETFLKVINMYGLLTKCEVKMAGHWPSSFFACLWTETKSRSID